MLREIFLIAANRQVKTFEANLTMTEVNFETFELTNNCYLISCLWEFYKEGSSFVVICRFNVQLQVYLVHSKRFLLMFHTQIKHQSLSY